MSNFAITGSLTVGGGTLQITPGDGATINGSLVTSQYDSGWFSISNATTYTLKHNLGTTNFLVVKEVASSSAPYGSGSSFSYYFTQGDMINSDGTSNSYAGGICETGRSSTYIRFETAKNYAYSYSRVGGSDDVKSTSAYARIRCFLLIGS